MGKTINTKLAINIGDCLRKIRMSQGDNITQSDVAEGYSFIPNFFIGAYIPDDLSYEKTNISHRNLDRKESMLCHFSNRLFDRDTLWLNHYDVNL
ncbi:MAG: hypothetical protein II364_05850, partial [Bacteroidales bacterium]|nr:hypothetical protein [Bacteroidales bacterium]